MVGDRVSPHTSRPASFTSAASYHRDYGLSPEVSSKLKEAMRDEKLLEVATVAKEVVETVSRAQTRIAVIGATGDGMSSFINALREMGHEEATSAPTGLLRTTLTPAMYTSPMFPDVSFWDLPGMGAMRQSLDNYLEEMQIGQYDFFLLMVSEWFNLYHLRLAKAIQASGKSFYIIWTKVDRDLDSTSLSKAYLLEKIRENIVVQLQQGQVQEPPIFVVSNLHPSLHDFPSLRKQLKEDVCYLRHLRSLEAFSRTCEEALDENMDSLTPKMEHFLKYLQDTLTVWDTEDPEQRVKSYHVCFGRHKESL